jgi:hypothetical protein
MGRKIAVFICTRKTIRPCPKKQYSLVYILQNNDPSHSSSTIFWRDIGNVPINKKLTRKFIMGISKSWARSIYLSPEEWNDRDMIAKIKTPCLGGEIMEVILRYIIE